MTTIDRVETNLDRAVGAVNDLFDTMIAGRGADADLATYAQERSNILQSYGYTDQTFRMACNAVLAAFAQANTHGIIATMPPKEQP